MVRVYLELLGMTFQNGLQRRAGFARKFSAICYAKNMGVDRNGRPAKGRLLPRWRFYGPRRVVLQELRGFWYFTVIIAY